MSVLEYLCLSIADVNETIAHDLSNFPNLNRLTFEHCEGFRDNVLSILASNAGNVEELCFIDCDDFTFGGITKIVENLLNLKKLSVYECQEIDSIGSDNYLSLKKNRNLEIFL